MAADAGDDIEGDVSDGINGGIDVGMDDRELLPDDGVGVAGRKAGACGMPAVIVWCVPPALVLAADDIAPGRTGGPDANT